MKKVKIIITDVDGVFTDGTVYKGNDGTEFKRFSVLDGAGVALAKSIGMKIIVISGRYSPATVARMEEMGLNNDCYQGVLNKVQVYEELKEKYSFSDEEVAFIGDDIIDIPVMERVGLPIAVANAVPMVKKIAKYVTESSGGEGAFREAVDMILTSQDIFEFAVENLRQKIMNDELK